MNPADQIISINRMRDYAESDVVYTHKMLKSRYYGSLPMPGLVVLAQAPVDGVMWYTVECSIAVGKELRQIGAESFVGKFYEHTSTMTDKFDISEDFYVFARVKWSNE